MKSILLVPLLLAACAGSPPREAREVERLKPEQPQTVTLEGVARNSKASAVLLAGDGRVIHIAGRSSWPTGVEGRAVRVDGRLVQAARLPRARPAPDGALVQGVAPDSAPEWWLDNALWSLVDGGPETAPWTLRVSDGSGNTTTASMEVGAPSARWRYAPVTPETSSSGSYSGGEPAAGDLSDAQVRELWSLVHALEAATDYHVEARAMGTTQVTVESPVGTRSFVLAPGSAADLEALLEKQKKSVGR